MATASVFAGTIGQLIINVGPTRTPAIQEVLVVVGGRQLLPKGHLNYRKPLPGEIPD